MVGQVLPSPVADDDVLPLEAHRGADGRADAHAEAERVELVAFETAVREALPGAHHRELRRPVHPARLLGAESRRRRVEVDLGGHL